MKTNKLFFAILFSALIITVTTNFAQEKQNKTDQEKVTAESNRDGLIADLTNLAALANQYYRKPKQLGGGEGHFTGWFIPEAIDTTRNGMFSAIITKSNITLSGTGNQIGNDGRHKVRVTMIVGPNKIESTIINN